MVRMTALFAYFALAVWAIAFVSMHEWLPAAACGIGFLILSFAWRYCSRASVAPSTGENDGIGYLL